eukprot:11174786-Lingulodinium_polyedra.AAC.1
MPRLRGLVTCINASQGPNARADALATEVEAAKDAGVNVANAVVEMAIERAILQAAEDGQIKQCTELLAWKETPESSTGISALAPDPAERLQKRLICRILQDWLRTDGDKHDMAMTKQAAATEKCLMFVRNVSSTTKDSLLRKELEKLKAVLEAPFLTDDAAITKAETARTELASTKTGLLYKPLALFSTGVYIMQRAADFFYQHKADAHHKATLDVLVSGAVSQDDAALCTD